EKILKEYTKPYEIELIKKNGDTFPALVSGKSININNIPHRISAIIDITELREKDKHIFEQAKLVSMGEMIGNIAHQWRQPLSVISTAATGMLMQKEYGILNDETFNKSCQDINEHAQYLSTTIDDFKNFIKGDREKSIFKLTESINEFLNLMESTIKEFNINIILNLQDDINIEGYPNELKQCIINIFNNAKDVLLDLKEEKIYIFITSYTKDNNIIIKIKDNGGGIPLDILPKIFEPYFTTKHQSDGTGLGLHMSYKLITNGMGGKLKAKNITYLYNDIQYTGAEFTISLPLH
ncbi:MAG: HAMP domain-containing histidine kinase, partial [Arcobacteraceae bacterium]|nr:HAMP domain-containing histidine kinase [Arcobacteraceae bacterium]